MIGENGGSPDQEGGLSLKEASEIFDTTVGALRQALRRGRVQGYKTEDGWRLYRASVQVYVQGEQTRARGDRKEPVYTPDSRKKSAGKSVKAGTNPEINGGEKIGEKSGLGLEAQLLEEIRQLRLLAEAQSLKIDRLEGEVRDSRAQLNQMNEQVVKALPAPRRTLWSKLFGRKRV